MKKLLLIMSFSLVLIFSVFAEAEGESILATFTNRNKESVVTTPEEPKLEISTSAIFYENTLEEDEEENNDSIFTESALKDLYYTEMEESSSYYDGFGGGSSSSSTAGSRSSDDFLSDSLLSGVNNNNSTSYSDGLTTTTKKTTSQASDSFVPSIEAKLAPDTDDVTVNIVMPEATTVASSEQYEFLDQDGFIRVTGIDGNNIITYIVGGDGGEIVEDPIFFIVEEYGYEAEIVGAVLKKYVTVASYAQREELDEEFLTEFEKAFNELRKAKKLTDLIPGLEEAIPEGYTIDDYAITQIFFVGPRNDIVEYIDEFNLLNLRMVFPYKIKKDQTEAPIVCYKIAKVEEWPVTVREDKLDVGDWGTIKSEDVVMHWPKEGRIAADFHHFGTIIFLEKKAK